MGTAANDEEVIRDKEIKKRLVLEAISTMCQKIADTSICKEDEDLSCALENDVQHDWKKAIGRVLIDTNLHDGTNTNRFRLQAKLLTGGVTNYSYKIWVEPTTCSDNRNENNNQDTKNASLQSPPSLPLPPPLFAKLSFPYALWNPDKNAHYDLARTDNEYEIMKTFSELRPEVIATPYECLDLMDYDETTQQQQPMKLLITQWSNGDEQWANQFIDGNVDERIVPKLTDALAALHCKTDFDPQFNTNVRPCMLNLFELYKETLLQAVSVEEEQTQAQSPPRREKDRTSSLCRHYGKDVLLQIHARNVENYHRVDCLVHSDVHAFNILVETAVAEKLDLSQHQFGPEGSVILCDWEMAFGGPIGRDMGLPQSFPIACIISHAMNGHVAVVRHLMSVLDLLWNEYAQAMANNHPQNKFDLTYVYRNCIAWNGWFLFLAYYVLGVQMEFFPVMNPGDGEKVRDAMGVLGLQMLRLGFLDNNNDKDDNGEAWTLEKLKSNYYSMIEEEIQFALEQRRPRRNRRSSMLRASGRRVSDAALHFADVSRLSSLCKNSSKKGSFRRGSLLIGETIAFDD